MHFSTSIFSICTSAIIYMIQIKCTDENIVYNLGSQLYHRENVLQDDKKTLEALKAKLEDIKTEQSSLSNDCNIEKQKLYDENIQKMNTLNNNCYLLSRKIQSLEDEIINMRTEFDILIGRQPTRE
ncbi:hypothetical protein EDEG_02035 [Edhazardia aedis USNM 41457]|uniref:Uncharacterized protein n=1 Tax=Edhazardia aedis (strain USNM 41457) TaxID=1003232 RepID=J8ZVH0_EDHAE|nr:hypothetical protein EDEG_02035 [Edhazardia aedis USNM 41457]|eukprot:EJW03638.1 hypothetical protein EDEG_02035 [Edhazardia aedis USNM 41457]